MLDAFDEFLNKDNEDGQRSELLDSLGKISRNVSTRFLITTRRNCAPELERAFKSESQVATVKGCSEDVEKYLDDELRRLIRLDDDLKATIRRTILDANREEASYL
jgi:hypothetical protein